MTKEELKNRISMALKDPILQQGFEIICKENAKLKKEVEISQRCWQDQKNISLDTNCKLHKAKELLNEFMRISKASDEDFEHDYSELIEEAEQFLREVSE